MKRFLLPVVLFTCTINVFSALRTWDGGGADANWQTAANWAGDVAPAVGDDLVFPAAAAQFSTNNNYFFLTTFRSITVEGGAYTFGGNAIRLTDGLIITSGSQTFNLPIALGASQSFTAATGSMVTIVLLSVGGNSLTLSGAGTIGIGVISGSGPVTKTGAGAAAIIAASGFSGPLTLNDGILVVDANIPDSTVMINAAPPAGSPFALSGFGGTGTVGATNVTQGAISSGTFTSPTGILNISSGLTFTANGAYISKLAGTIPGANGHDQLNVNGSVTLGNARLVPLPWDGFRAAVGSTFVILKNDGTDPTNGTFLNAPEGAVFAGPLNTAFWITYTGGDGNDVAITRVPRARYDFDGDGKTDLSVFRPLDRNWYVLKSAAGGVAVTNWGLPSDILTPADFDGDNKFDTAVYRPSSGQWFILRSFDSTVQIADFGISGDIPVARDYDGDGRADLAQYRPSDGNWYVHGSVLNTVTITNWGNSSDTPIPGDYDGDGITDVAVYRGSNGTWYVLRSSGGGYAAPWGNSTDRPTPADYDGDGKDDLAVYRPLEGNWYVLRSTDNGFDIVQWGNATDVPVPGDYDGDGKNDYAVYRAGTWFVLRSTSGFLIANWGTTGDIPIPSKYIP